MIAHSKTIFGAIVSFAFATMANAQTVTKTVEIPFTNHIAAEMIEVDVFVGPYPKGEAIGMTLEDWLAASGTAVVTCSGEKGTVEAEFANLVPNGVYTMWYWLVAVPLPAKFHTYDLPVGARDGSQSVFKADANGNARYSAPVEPCLQGSGKQFETGLAIAYHSDGKTYGYSPGDFGNRAHVHLFNSFPQDSDM